MNNIWNQDLSHLKPWGWRKYYLETQKGYEFIYYHRPSEIKKGNANLKIKFWKKEEEWFFIDLEYHIDERNIIRIDEIKWVKTNYYYYDDNDKKCFKKDEDFKDFKL